jgi:2'-deoxynucleoside 5'-phosphate N-hydrolase
MRIYLACTVRGDRATVLAARRIHDCLRRMGHEVLTSHLLDDNVDQAESRLTDGDVYRRDLEWLTGADAVVAEASGSSYGVGFEVGFVLGRAAGTGQRALVLYDASRQGKVSRLISGLDHPAARVLAYGSLDEIDAFLRANLSTAP